MADSATELEQATSPWERLRRRKVVQWGLLYAAGAWGFLQGLGYVSDVFDWPGQIQRVALLALVIFLPIVLVLAWYHGDRGQQRVTGPETAIVTLLFLLGGAIFWQYERTSGQSSPVAKGTPSSNAATSAADSRPSIAVLPFENRSRLNDDAFFVDGIHDDILTQLSKVSALRVISRTSVERFRTTNLSVQQIAEQLGVATILEGGVQRAGDRVRINVQLIDATTDAHRWAETYDRELTAANIFAIQSELAQAIAAALKAALTPAEQARSQLVPTNNLEAWEAYQLGKQQVAHRNSEGLRQAEEHFKRAIALDPRFVLAHVGLADTALHRYYYAGGTRDETLTKMQREIDLALQIDPESAEAFVSAARLAELRMEYQVAERMYRRAIELNPGYATAHHWFANVLGVQGHAEEAVKELRIAASLDPLSGAIANSLGVALESRGDFGGAESAYHKAVEIAPTMASPYVSLGGFVALTHGRLDLAIPYFEKAATLDSGNPAPLVALADIYRVLGDRAQAALWLQRALKTGPQDEYVHADAATYFFEADDYDTGRAYARTAANDPWAMNPLRIVEIRDGNFSEMRERYAKAFPGLVATSPAVNLGNLPVALELASVLQHTGEKALASKLLASSEAIIKRMPRMGQYGYGLSDVVIHALRGETDQAIEKLREARKLGYPIFPYQRYLDPSLESIRDDPRFQEIFSEMDREMAHQRAALAARPRDAPLDLAATGT